MAKTKKHSKSNTTPSHQQPLLSEPQQQQTQPPQQYVVVLRNYPPPHEHHLLFRKSCQRCITSFAIFILFFVAASFILWPAEPHLSVVRLRLDRLQFHRTPKISLDAALDLTVKILNVDVYSVDYDSLNVQISYRGEKLGVVTSDRGLVKPRGSSYVNATLQFDGVEIMSNIIPLIEDFARGEVLLDTVTEMSGRLGLYLFDLPLKTTISCGVIVNTYNQTISRQSCYPEVSEVSETQMLADSAFGTYKETK